MFRRSVVGFSKEDPLAVCQVFLPVPPVDPRGRGRFAAGRPISRCRGRRGQCASARRERGQKGPIPSRKSIDPGLCANPGMRAVAEAAIVSRGNPIVALTKWSRVAGSVGVFQRPRRSRCIEREHPNAHSRARLEKLCALPRRPGSWGSSPRSRTSAPSTVTRACATMAQRHRPQIFAERTANVDE